MIEVKLSLEKMLSLYEVTHPSLKGHMPICIGYLAQRECIMN